MGIVDEAFEIVHSTVTLVELSEIADTVRRIDTFLHTGLLNGHEPKDGDTHIFETWQLSRNCVEAAVFCEKAGIGFVYHIGGGGFHGWLGSGRGSDDFFGVVVISACCES